jgi:hypothetical protein
MCSINPITNPNSVCSHSKSWQYYHPICVHKFLVICSLEVFRPIFSMHSSSLIRPTCPAHLITVIIAILPHLLKNANYAKFEVLRAESINITVSWERTPYTSANTYQYLRRICCLHPHGRKIKLLLWRWWLRSRRLSFLPENRSSTILRHVGTYLSNSEIQISEEK